MTTESNVQKYYCKSLIETNNHQIEFFLALLLTSRLFKQQKFDRFPFVKSIKQ
jgi:hypothetical protein